MSKRIALLVESSRGFGRDLLRGVAAYVRTHESFSVYKHERALSDRVPEWLSHWQGDGVIARIETRELAEFLLQSDWPTVDLRGRFNLPGIPTIATNDLSVVSLACDHFIERGIRNFAFCGFENINYSASRQELAEQYLSQRGLPLSIYNSPAGHSDDTSNIEAEGLIHEEHLVAWLKTLPKQTGVIACNDIRGAQVLNVCREIDIAIPDELAVIGVDDDRLICELTTPPLSSVVPSAYRIGYMAVEMLSKMMHGETIVEETIQISASSVVNRASTDLLAIDDAEIVAALKFIRENAGKGISVDDVAAAVNMSRSTLDRRFARHTSTTAKNEITKIRVERVMRLLADTEYTLTEIADLTGYSNVEYLSTMFKQHTGETPGQYRRLYHTLRTTQE